MPYDKMNESNWCTKSDFPTGPGANQPDPNFFAPLLVGDWVSFEAVNVGGDLWAAYSLDANLGLYTAAGTAPVYITIDVAQWGIVGSRDGEVAETRVRTPFCMVYSRTNTNGSRSKDTSRMKPRTLKCSLSMSIPALESKPSVF